MIEHISLPVSNFAQAKEFYLAALEPLGYKLNMDFEGAAGFMEGGHTSFWIVEKPEIINIHVAFLAKNKDAVHMFYDAAMKAGATDHGAPGPRKEYSPDYYAAFVLDRDDHNIEAVCYDEAAA